MRSPLNIQQQKVLVAFGKIAVKADESGLWDELKALCASPKSVTDVREAISEAEPLWAVDIPAAGAPPSHVHAAEDRLQWEDAVLDVMGNIGQMSRSDAQGIVEAQEMQGEDPLGKAWKSGLTSERAAYTILDMKPEEEEAQALSQVDCQKIKVALEDLMRAIVRAGQNAGIIRLDLESVSTGQCIQILDDLSSANPPSKG